MTRVDRLAKLRAMTPREVLSRTTYAVYLGYERALHRAGWLARSGRLRRALDPSLSSNARWQKALVRRASARRAFASFDAPERVRALFEDRFAAERLKARQVGDEVARGRIAFFGEQFSVGPETSWHADPVTGTQWPMAFHADMAVHTGNVGFGDVKHVWEINRHQFFVDLAKVAFLDRSRTHAEALSVLLRHWTADVPYATGAPWACALEPAFRVWSWLWAYELVRAADLLDDDTHLLWLSGFYDHGCFLHRHLETYSSPYNHLIGEASALFVLGLLFPEFREARSWAARGRDVLERSLAAQFHADGGSVEQSTFYHHATVGFYLLALVVAQRFGRPLSTDVQKAVERGIEFSATLIQPNGRLPRFGGADDGKPIRLEHLPLWDFRPYQAIGAVLFSRPDFRFVAGRFWEDAVWVLGPDAALDFDRLVPQQPPTEAAREASGYYVSRSDWSSQADYLCVDCGEQAGGLRRDDVPSAAHGHADCLSVVASLGGHEVLVDPGFFCYNGDPEWEVHFRKTGAHNTLTIDGLDQADHVSKMAWTHTYRAKLESWSSFHERGCFVGSHDGYRRHGQGVDHRRTVWLRSGYLVIQDEVTGPPGRHVTATFQFAPGHLDLEGSSVVFDHRFELVWACSDSLRSSVACGGDHPADGWIAASLGVRHAAPRLSLEFTTNAQRAVLLTILADTRATATRGPTRVSSSKAADHLRASVHGADWVDEVIAGITGSASTPQVQTDAPLVILRRADDGSITALGAGGTYAQVTSDVNSAAATLG